MKRFRNSGISAIFSKTFKESKKIHANKKMTQINRHKK